MYKAVNKTKGIWCYIYWYPTLVSPGKPHFRVLRSYSEVGRTSGRTSILQFATSKNNVALIYYNLISTYVTNIWCSSIVLINIPNDSHWLPVPASRTLQQWRLRPTLSRNSRRRSKPLKWLTSAWPICMWHKYMTLLPRHLPHSLRQRWGEAQHDGADQQRRCIHYRVWRVISPAGTPGYLRFRYRHNEKRFPWHPKKGGLPQGKDCGQGNLQCGQKLGQPFYGPRRRKCLDLSTFEGAYYVLCKAKNQGAAGLAPGCLHVAPHNWLASAPGRNADDAGQHRHNPAIYCGVGEGAATSGKGGNAYPG